MNPLESHPAGERLFSRYAYSPNERGYCGPSGAEALAAVARGEAVDCDVRQVASRFSGTWAYQLVIGAMLGLDPLDEEVVRGYWVGTAATESLDRAEFWQRLLAIIGPQAGTYWRHLDAGLALEATPSHAFHVLGVYPWTRLLSTGRPEPVGVIDSCCIRPGRVVSVTPAAGAATGGSAGPESAASGSFIAVEALELRFEAGRLALETTVHSVVPSLFVSDIAVGDSVALHWGAICDRLDRTDVAVLTHRLADQVDRVNHRLARA